MTYGGPTGFFRQSQQDARDLNAALATDAVMTKQPGNEWGEERIG
jgi:hypothetical protein